MKRFLLLLIFHCATTYIYAQCFYKGNAYNVGTTITFDNGVKNKCQCIIPAQNSQPCNAAWVAVQAPAPAPSRPPQPVPQQPVPRQPVPQQNVPQQNTPQQHTAPPRASVLGNLNLRIEKDVRIVYDKQKGRGIACYPQVTILNGIGKDISFFIELKYSTTLDDLSSSSIAYHNTIKYKCTDDIQYLEKFYIFIPYLEFSRRLKPGTTYNVCVKVDILNSGSVLKQSEWKYFSVIFNDSDINTTPQFGVR
jgi:hypothetical protein